MKNNHIDWLITLLQKWQSADIEQRHLHEEVENFTSTLWKEKKLLHEDTSVASQALQMLENLHINWILVEDVPFLINMLEKSKLEEDNIALQKEWDKYWQDVNADSDERRKAASERGYYIVAIP